MLGWLAGWGFLMKISVGGWELGRDLCLRFLDGKDAGMRRREGERWGVVCGKIRGFEGEVSGCWGGFFLGGGGGNRLCFMRLVVVVVGAHRRGMHGLSME